MVDIKELEKRFDYSCNTNKKCRKKYNVSSCCSCKHYKCDNIHKNDELLKKLRIARNQEV